MTNFFLDLMKFLLDLGRRVFETAILTAVAAFVTHYMERHFNYGQA